MKTPLIWIVLLVMAQPATAILRNAGPPVPATFAGNHLSSSRPNAVLYAPSEADDPAYRAGIAAYLPSGYVVDYFDARYGTPDPTLLGSYSAVHTWANYAYLDKVQFGNNLADYVDHGGWVVLGAFCTYCSGNCLSGAIMTATYCPVYSPSQSNHFSPSDWSGDDADKCDYSGVSGWSAYYRDYLTLQGSGTLRGTFVDGEIAGAAGSSSYAVHYINGSGGAPILWDSRIEQVVANACYCYTIPPPPPPPPPSPTEQRSWGSVKELYR